MKPHEFYMHKDAMDICFEVIKVKGHWTNLGYTGKPWQLILNSGRPEKLKVYIADRQNWINITDSVCNTRLKPGLPEKRLR